MSSEKESQGLSFPELLRRLATLARPHRKRAVLVGALLLATLSLELVQPAIIGSAVNGLETDLTAAQAKETALRGIAYFGVLLLVVSALRCAMMFVTGIQQTRLTQIILWTLRRGLYDAMQRLSFSFFDSAESGQLISRSTTDVQRVARFFNAAFFSSIEALVVLAGTAAYMFYMSPLLALVALSPMPLTIFMVVRVAQKVRPVWREARDAYGAVTTDIQENIAGIRVIRAFAKEDYEIERFAGTSNSYIAKLLEGIDKWAMRVPFAMFVYGLNMPLVLFAGGYLVMRGPDAGGLEIGTLLAFIIYSRNMTWRVRMIERIVGATARASAAAERIYEILDMKPDVAEKRGAVDLPEGKGEVSFEDVSFSYVAGSPVLSNVNLKVRGGQMVALVGHTGSGKTTMVNLLPRFYDVDAGSVKIDGVDVRDLRLASLRKNVALIFQETFLFSASIAENIAYARPEASEEEIVRCAKAAQAHDFVMTLEQGYNTVIGERGVTLSGGQRQRVSIARALLADPRILIMDDATASVDSATERQIQEALFELSRGRTTFVIAHRISTVRRADLIVVLENGRIVETGTHDQLLALGGIYRAVCDVQFYGASEDAETRP